MRGARSNVTSNKGGFQLIYLSIIAYWVRLYITTFACHNAIFKWTKSLPSTHMHDKYNVNFDEIDQNNSQGSSRHPHSSMGFFSILQFCYMKNFLGFNMAAPHGMRTFWNFSCIRGMAISFSKQMEFLKCLKYFSSIFPPVNPIISTLLAPVTRLRKACCIHSSARSSQLSDTNQFPSENRPPVEQSDVLKPSDAGKTASKCRKDILFAKIFILRSIILILQIN